MKNSEEAQEEGWSLTMTCCYGEALLTFKVTKKCMSSMRLSQWLGPWCLVGLSCELWIGHMASSY